MAFATLFLCSDLAGMTQGHTLVVGRGYSMKTQIKFRTTG